MLAIIWKKNSVIEVHVKLMYGMFVWKSLQNFKQTHRNTF